MANTTQAKKHPLPRWAGWLAGYAAVLAAAAGLVYFWRVVFSLSGHIGALWPTLGAMGLAKYANIAVVFGTAVYLLGALLLWFTVGINLVTLCLLTSVTEGSILAFRLVVIVKNRKLMGASRTPQ